MELKTLKTLTAAALLAATTAASAGTSPFTLVSGAYAPGVDVTLTLQESTVPGYDYDFVINNNALGIVTGIYFERDWTTKLTGVGTSSGPAVLLPGSASPDVAGWEGPMGSHTVAQNVTRVYHARGRYSLVYSDILADGLDSGQSQKISFMTDTDIVSLDDLEDMLGTGGFGVAVRVQDIVGDPQDAGFGTADPIEEEVVLQVLRSNVNVQEQTQVTGAPTPTAALAGLTMLGVMGMRRRRK